MGGAPLVASERRARGSWERGVVCPTAHSGVRSVHRSTPFSTASLCCVGSRKSDFLPYLLNTGWAAALPARYHARYLLYTSLAQSASVICIQHACRVHIYICARASLCERPQFRRRSVFANRDNMAGVHSTSVYIQPLENPTAFAKAEFVDFAPAACICTTCCASEAAKKRSYAIMYDSKLEINRPFEPCMCCSTENCIVDRVSTAYLDKPPFRTGMHIRPLKSGSPSAAELASQF